jgi:hypothetical protein
MLSESFPPLRYNTTRFRRERPCARARSERKAGAAKLIVNAATPPRTNSRLVMGMCAFLYHSEGLRPSDSLTRSLAGPHKPHSARVGSLVRSFAAVIAF